jgi:hypothetical protein
VDEALRFCALRDIDSGEELLVRYATFSQAGDGPG